MSLHAVEDGRYTLLGEQTDFGLRAGTVHRVEATVEGRSVTVSVDGRTAVEHQLSVEHQARYGSNTDHGLRVMRNSRADDGGSRWLDVTIENK